jgi:hypothetical protein
MSLASRILNSRSRGAESIEIQDFTQLLRDFIRGDHRAKLVRGRWVGVAILRVLRKVMRRPTSIGREE